MYAARNGHLECVRELLSSEKILQNTCGTTALMIAAARGLSDMVGLLAPAEGGMKDRAGRTALIWAASSGALGLSAEMCSGTLRDVDPIVDRDLESRLDGASPFAGGKALGLLQTGPGAKSAGDEGYVFAVQALLAGEAGAQDADGATALMQAVWSEKRALIEALFPKESGLKAKNGATALRILMTRPVSQERAACLRAMA